MMVEAGAVAASGVEPIYVESEWAPLRECVYGSPDTWVLPVFLSDVKLRAQGEFGEFWAKNQGRDVKEAWPELFAEFSGQVKIYQLNAKDKTFKTLQDFTEY